MNTKTLLTVLFFVCQLCIKAQNFDENVQITNYATSYGSGKSLIFGHSQQGSTVPVGTLRSFLVDGSTMRAGKLIFQTSQAGQLQDRMLIHESGLVEFRNGINLLNLGSTYGSGQEVVFGHSQEGSNAPIASIKSFLVNGSSARAGNLIFRTSANGQLYDRMIINSSGKVGIGTSDFTGDHKLRVEGSIGAREIKVEATGWSDFVFENDYELRTLEEVEDYITQNKHLPEVPSEAEVTENGINLGEMNAKLLQKIEELTLYLIEQNKENQEQRKLIEELQKEVSALKNG